MTTRVDLLEYRVLGVERTVNVLETKIRMILHYLTDQTGFKGDQGHVGEQGPRGEKGPRGERGEAWLGR